MSLKPHITLLDCTLRDGSYVIDNQFTAQDTALLARGLQRAGFSFIEVGHGTGLGSYRKRKYEQAASDRAYIEAAKSAVAGTQARIGVFFIPGIGTMEDLKAAVEAGLDFVRIGTDVTDVEKAAPFIEQAKAWGLFVCANLMKSYAVPPKTFATLAKQADKFGADVIGIIDSAGGMLPADVTQYVLALQEVTTKKIGFHGHNNLHLAVANALAAVEAGAVFIDSTLQGMGRSAGNTQTEIMVPLLEKLGYQTGIDPMRTFDLGERVVKTMMNRDQGIDDVSVISGIAQFHSSFLGLVEAAARRHGVDVRQLIIAVSEKDRIKVTAEGVETLAQSLSARPAQDVPTTAPPLFPDPAVLSTDPLARLETVVGELVALSRKTGKPSVLSLTLSPKKIPAFPYVRQSPSFIVGNVEAADRLQAEAFLKHTDGRLDWICLDNTCPDLRGLEKILTKSAWAWYAEARSVHLSLEALLQERCTRGRVLFLCDPQTKKMFQHTLSFCQLEVVGSEDLAAPTDTWDIQAIVSFGADYAQSLSPQSARHLAPGTLVVAVYPHAFSPAFLQAAATQQAIPLRLDTRTGLNAELHLAIEARKMALVTGKSSIQGADVVAGGYIGPRGTVVVDSIESPGQVLGIADGGGGLLTATEELSFADQKKNVLAHILWEQIY